MGLRIYQEAPSPTPKMPGQTGIANVASRKLYELYFFDSFQEAEYALPDFMPVTFVRSVYHHDIICSIPGSVNSSGKHGHKSIGYGASRVRFCGSYNCIQCCPTRALNGSPIKH